MQAISFISDWTNQKTQAQNIQSKAYFYENSWAEWTVAGKSDSKLWA